MSVTDANNKKIEQCQSIQGAVCGIAKLPQLKTKHEEAAVSCAPRSTEDIRLAPTWTTFKPS